MDNMYPFIVDDFLPEEERFDFVLGDGTHLLILKQYLMNKSKTIKNASKYGTTNNLWDLRQCPDVETAVWFFRALSLDWDWLYNLEKHRLKPIFKNFHAMIDYLDLEEQIYDTWLNLAVFNSFIYSWRIIFFLTYVAGYTEKIKERVTIKLSIFSFKNSDEHKQYLQNSAPYIDDLIEYLAPINDDLFLLCHDLCKNHFNSKEYEIVKEFDEKFHSKLIRFVDGGWEWVNRLDEWPSNLLLIGEIFEALVDDKINSWNGQLIKFMVLGSKEREIQSALNFLIRDVEYGIDASIRCRKIFYLPGAKTIEVTIKSSDESFEEVGHRYRGYFNGKIISITRETKLTLYTRLIHLNLRDLTFNRLLLIYEHDLKMVNYEEVFGYLEEMFRQISPEIPFNSIIEMIKNFDRSGLDKIFSGYSRLRSIGFDRYFFSRTLSF